MQQDQLNQGELLLPGRQVDPSRRAFLQWTGFGLAGAVATGCSRGPARAVVPYLDAPEDIVPGRGYRIATTCAGCSAACGVIARCRDGRPIKLEGNGLHALSRGGLCAVGQAGVLSLYDAQRLGMPESAGEPLAWDAATTRLRSALGTGKVRLLTGTLTSPSTRHWIDRFLAAGGDRKHVVFDSQSASAILDAHQRTHGVRALPAYQFQAAHVIASFDADFLGTWISPVSFAADYAAGRRPDGDHPQVSRHLQYEARMSLTGAAADRRTRLAPWQQRAALAELAAQLEQRAGVATRVGDARQAVDAELGMTALADELWAARGHALVVCGSNDLETQVYVNHANALLDAYGSTLSLARPSLQRAGSDAAVMELCGELAAGEVEVLIVSGINPAFEWPDELAATLERAGTLIVHAEERNETTALADLVLPAPHALEAWDDAEPLEGRFSLTQPTVRDLRDGHSLRWVLATALDAGADERELLAAHWRAEIHARAGGGDFDAFFDRALHDGWVEGRAPTGSEPAFDADAIQPPTAVEPVDFALVAHASVGMLDGRHAHNPWLQELPDPVTKVTWDNVASLSIARADALGVEQGDVVRITTADGAHAVELPVVVQRGQHDDVVAVALGYGRAGTDRFHGVGPDWFEGRPTVEPGGTVGSRVEALRRMQGDLLASDGIGATITKTGATVQLACTQEHHSLEVPPHLAPEGAEVRDAARTVALADFVHDPEHAVAGHGHHGGGNSDLWTDDHGGALHHWGMSIDLNRCTGCSGCVIACQAENNVPVVGRDEVARHREMHWIRIDRYTQGFGDDTSTVHQPMFCQQCDNAPCEAVCPVLATVHSSEGLNQQVYNRCVGTRYCANTCPYKVRRFNWFEYPREDENQNHALNPDVTVRSRGVMEKCSFCAQRIQEAKSESARTGTPLADGDIQVACQQSCPTQAIVFGDLNDPESEVSKHSAQVRAYGVLEEINVKPSVRYLAKVANTGGKENGHAH